MKKTLGFLLITSIYFSESLYAQENTLPQNGNVGIGTTNPNVPLEVKGQVKVEGPLTVDGNVRIENLPLKAQVNLLELDMLFIDHNGDIIRGKSNGIKWPGPNPNPQLDCSSTTSGVVKGNWQSGDNAIYVACPEVNVGINTTLPRVKLDVRGITYSQRMSIGNVVPAQMKGLFHIKSDQAGLLNTPLFIIENSESKLLQLDNDGLLRTREVKLDRQTWPDYVFDKNYKLSPLSEVEKYIATNHHLPNIPSAKEVTENGLKLGEMNQLMMEKIEELTLYLIQQEKRLLEQEEKIKKLEAALQLGSEAEVLDQKQDKR